MAVVIACGAFESGQRARLREAGQQAGVELKLCDSPLDVTRLLDQQDVRALLTKGTGDDVASLAVAARASSRHRHLPIVALDDGIDDLTFSTALGWGADDLLPSDQFYSIVSRLRAVARSAGPPSSPNKGTAVLAEPDQARRVAIARILYAAGFGVRFASEQEEIRDAVLDIRVGLTVFDASMVSDAGALVEEAVAAGAMSRNVVSVGSKDFPSLTRRLATVRIARVIHDASPPENVVFMANEMAVPDLVNKRAHPRELYGTCVWFRQEGHREVEVGFTYNVSVEGLFLRTMADAPGPRLWLELEPPRGNRRVHLVAEVAWSRPFGPDGSATVPPGFGLKIVEGAESDLALWRRGCGAPPASRVLEH